MNDLLKAMSMAQGEFSSVTKNKVVIKRGKDKYDKWFEYQYKYADLDSIIEMLRPVLAKYGLFFSQSIEENVCVTTIYGANGTQIKSHCPLKIETTDMQKIGATITYAKRYGLSLAFGLSTDEDSDANELTNESYDKRDVASGSNKNEAKPQTKGSVTNINHSATAAEINRPPAEYTKPTQDEKTTYPGGLTRAQLKRLYAISGSKKWNPDYTDAWLMASFNKKQTNLNRTEYDTACEFFEKNQFNAIYQDQFKDYLPTKLVNHAEKVLAKDPEYTAET